MDIDKEAERILTEKREGRRWRITTVLGEFLVRLGAMVFGKEFFDPPTEIHEMEIHLPRLDPAFAGYRLVQISDIHMNSMRLERLEETIRAVNSLHADLIAVTGDFVTHEPDRYRDVLVGALKELRAKDGVYAILGNHDHWAGPKAVRQILREAGIVELRNRSVSLERGQAILHLAGVDCTYMSEDRLDEVLGGLPGEGAAILLAHEPDYADVSAETGRFDLQLSGHSHGGQANLPLVGSPFLPPHARKYPRGLYQINGMQLYTNRGLGTIHVAARLNCPPEITVFTLCPQESER